MCNKSSFIVAADVMCSASDFSYTANTHSVNFGFKKQVPTNFFIHFFMIGNLGHITIDFWVLNETIVITVFIIDSTYTLHRRTRLSQHKKSLIAIPRTSGMSHIYIHTYTVLNEPLIYIKLFFPEQT